MVAHSRKSLLLAAVVIMGTGLPAFADWDPGQPAKWVQLPDLSQTGMDVYATFPKILADDWLCTSTDPVTDIHIWGSWYRDILPHNAAGAPDPAAVLFKLSIHTDIPAGAGGVPYSRPGPEVWSTITPASAVRPYGTGPEGFYNPNTGVYEFPGDNLAFQYNFKDFPNPFIQQGTPTNPLIYWLDVQALVQTVQPPDPQPIFGWKTAIPPHQIDDAVFSDTDVFGGPIIQPWVDMHYPSGHPFAGQSFDLSFVITTIPEPASLLLLGLGALVLIRRKN